MKKFLLWLLLVLVAVALIVGGALLYFYNSVDETNVNAPAVTLNGQALTPNHTVWYTPVFGGAMYKKYETPDTLTVQALGTFDAPALTLQSAAPDASVRITVENASGETVFDGTQTEFDAYSFTANGAYTAYVTLEKPRGEAASYGQLAYKASFVLAVEPTIEFSATRVTQGDVICVRVNGIMGDETPEIETALSLTQFIPTRGGQAAFIGISYNREAGDYVVKVRCGQTQLQQTVTVVYNSFTRQDLIMDQSTADATVNSAAANEEWRKAIWPLYETADAALYWEGLFLQPVQGRVTSEYGLFRYTNGSKTPVRHAGIDLAAPDGTPIQAPNGGKVVYAGFLQLTGNTIVIEHGAGLKSYFFHLSALNCAQGDIVEKGQQIGYVGSTGYSTGPHLHYEVKIGNQSINPWDLFDGKSGVFFAS